MDTSSRIFVRGLPPSITEAEFRKHFSAKNREITDVKLIPQRRIGYVGYKTPDDASQAVKYFNKSYIRMSKIAVEIARPISDPSLIKTRDSSRRNEPPTGMGFPASSANAEDVSRKRKREEPDKPDPKLKEFLAAMGSGKEGLGIDHDMPDVVPTEPIEAESDNEYEEIPARKEKQRKLEGPTQKPSQSTVDVPLKVSEARRSGHDPPTETVAESLPTVDTNAGHMPTETTDDDDWLRSRTNRLLDLMDPEDISTHPPAIPPQTAQGAAPTANQETASHSKESLDHGPDDTSAGDEPSAKQPSREDGLDTIRKTGRLFVRNLAFSVTEDDLREALDKFGPVQEVHLPVDASGKKKGYALVLFVDPQHAVEAFQSMDGTTFQGRIVHIIPGNRKRDEDMDEFAISKLPLKKQNMIRKKAGAASTTFNWNSLYMNQDAVNSAVADRLGVSKSELLDPTSADAAVKQAIAETTVIQDAKAYFAANGVDLDAFKSNKRGDRAILVKNFPYGTTLEEIRSLFEESGPVLKVLMPPHGTTAIVLFSQPNHAKTAFGRLAYRRIKDSVLFLEKAPRDLFKSDVTDDATDVKDRQPIGVQKLSVNDLLSNVDKAEEEVETTSLFVRNLNFTTTTSQLADAFRALDGFVSGRVKTKMDPKKPGQTLSMGFGFVEFRTKPQAQAALKVMDGFVLDGHTLSVKASHRGHDAAEERRREDRAKKVAAQRTKIIIKNLPFQATKKDIRALFGTYGQLKSVRIPKKADYSTRGFGFADFVTSREAENAINALRDTHLLGRRLVLDFAEADAVDAEEEIEKMQRKVGGQVNKVAVQKLTSGGRKKVTIGEEGNEEDFEG